MRLRTIFNDWVQRTNKKRLRLMDPFPFGIAMDSSVWKRRWDNLLERVILLADQVEERQRDEERDHHKLPTRMPPARAWDSPPHTSGARLQN